MMQLPPIRDHAAFLRNAAAAEWKPADILHRAQMADIFAQPAPVEVDLGCGEGRFLWEMARRHPERNFLGTERMPARVRRVCRLISRTQLTNARIVQLESKYVITRLLPAASVARAWVLFPDPWPKRHHQVRRLFQDDFMVALHALLEPGGEVRIKTDDLPYFMWIEKVLARAHGFERLACEPEPDEPLTNFERKFLDQGLAIHRARLRKV